MVPKGRGIDLSLFVGFCAWTLFCYEVHSVHFFAIILKIGGGGGGGGAGCLFKLFSWLMSCDCQCSVFLPRGAMGWSAVFHCCALYFQIILTSHN